MAILGSYTLHKALPVSQLESLNQLQMLAWGVFRLRNVD